MVAGGGLGWVGLGWVKASSRRPGPRTTLIPARRNWPGQFAVVWSQGLLDCGPPPFPAVARAGGRCRRACVYVVHAGGGRGGGGVDPLCGIPFAHFLHLLLDGVLQDKRETCGNR